jgi:hypothetical protein
LNNILLIKQGILFLTYVVIQALFAKNLELFGVAFCFVYFNFLLLLPLHTDRVLLLVMGFGLGLAIDAFYDTLGIHAFACVFVAYLRPWVITLLAPNEELYALTIRETGLIWFVRYVAILTFLHHLLLFSLQQFNFNLFFDVLIKTMSSTLFTGICVILIQYLFYTANDRK